MSHRHVGGGRTLRQPQLGAWLRDRLEALALNPREAAIATGLPSANIRAWASGRRTPRPQSWERMMAVVGGGARRPAPEPEPEPAPPPQPEPLESPDGLRELLEGLVQGAGLRAVVLVLEPRKGAPGQLSLWR